MISEFRILIEDFARQNGLDWTWRSDIAGSLDLEGYSLQIGLLESGGLLVIKCGVGMPPTDLRERELFWKKILMANNTFCGTGGGTLGYDEETDLVTFQVAWPVKGLDVESLNDLALNMTDFAIQWTLRLLPNPYAEQPCGIGQDEELRDMLRA